MPSLSSQPKISKEKACALAEEFAGGTADLDRTRIGTVCALAAEANVPSAQGQTGNELGYLVPMTGTGTKPFRYAQYKTGFAIIAGDTGELRALTLFP